MKENCVTMDGTIVGVNRNSATMELANGSVRLLKHRIRVLAGDKVRLMA